jgi:hypothetical protein
MRRGCSILCSLPHIQFADGTWSRSDDVVAITNALTPGKACADEQTAETSFGIVQTRQREF